ncbi:MAG: hypothetical protein J5659_04770 [Clostridia bacterium]|nr:hypothetical protein [Clostridia bacterium]
MTRKPPQQQRKPQPPGVDAELVQHGLNAFILPAIDTTDARAVEERITEFLHQCIDDDHLPTVAGVACALGVSVRELQYWKSGQRGSREHQRIINKFYAILEDIYIQDLQANRYDPKAGIFIGKTYYGLRDT